MNIIDILSYCAAFFWLAILFHAVASAVFFSRGRFKFMLPWAAEVLTGAFLAFGVVLALTDLGDIYGVVDLKVSGMKAAVGFLGALLYLQGNWRLRNTKQA
jgi:hypothetical protein